MIKDDALAASFYLFIPSVWLTAHRLLNDSFARASLTMNNTDNTNQLFLHSEGIDQSNKVDTDTPALSVKCLLLTSYFPTNSLWTHTTKYHPTGFFLGTSHRRSKLISDWHLATNSVSVCSENKEVEFTGGVPSIWSRAIHVLIQNGLLKCVHLFFPFIYFWKSVSTL